MSGFRQKFSHVTCVLLWW